MTIRWYHASPKRFPVGTVLSGVYSRSYAKNMVCLHRSLLPHYTISDDAEKKNWHIYEVEPLEKIVPGMWNEATVHAAKVLRYCGSARGIAKSRRRGLNTRYGRSDEERMGVSVADINRYNKKF